MPYNLKLLKNAHSFNDLAAILGYSPSGLSYLLYKKSNNTKYSEFYIKKRDGTDRRILAPCPEIKRLQIKLSEILYECTEEIEKNGTESSFSHGFRKNHSIITNSVHHKNKKFVFNIDIKNFFDAINFGRVMGFFLKNKNYKLHYDVAKSLAAIACFENKLPQGSPCSPIISDLIASILDHRLFTLAKKYKCSYTRYADDITFSTNKKSFPSQIALESSDHTWITGEKLAKEIRKSGFKVNNKKTRMQYEYSRQEVTGLVVNKKVNVRSEYRRNTRAMLHNLLQEGYFYINQETKEHGSIDQIGGRLGFINHIDNFNNTSKNKDSSQEILYRRFLLFREFHTATMTTIICEGKTDNIYLANAIKNLAINFPELCNISNNKKTLQVKLFKYKESSTNKALKLNGGSGDLKNFIRNYKKERTRFKTSPTNPVIILVDNDKAGRQTYSLAKQECKLDHADSNEPFINLFGNIYLTATPLPKGENNSEIEDCFEPALKKIKIGDRKFTSNNEFNPNTHYGKNDFARKIIDRNADQINFSGFLPLLRNIVAAIRHFNTNKH